MQTFGLNRNQATMVVLFLFAVALRLGFWAVYGTVSSNDSYMTVCTLYFSDPLAVLWAHKGIVYAGFTFPLCSVLSIPGATIETWLSVQILLSAFGCVLLYRIGTIVANYTTGIVAGGALAVLWDTFFWDAAVLSDSLFTFTVILCAWAIVRYTKHPSQRNRLVVFFTLGYLAITRPHGIVIALGWLSFDLFSRTDKRFGIFSRRIVPATIFALVPLAIPSVMRRRNLYPKWREGWIVIQDTSFFVYDIPSSDPGLIQYILENIHHLAIMGVLKVVFFFAPFLPRHSLSHMVLDIFTMIPIYIIGVFGLVHARRNHYQLYRLCIGPIIAMLLITAVTFVSYDFRYRAPLGPLFALACGYYISLVDFDWYQDKLYDLVIRSN